MISANYIDRWAKDWSWNRGASAHHQTSLLAPNGLIMGKYVVQYDKAFGLSEYGQITWVRLVLDKGMALS